MFIGIVPGRVWLCEADTEPGQEIGPIELPESITAQLDCNWMAFLEIGPARGGWRILAVESMYCPPRDDEVECFRAYRGQEHPTVFHIYSLRCANGSHYTGISSNVAERLYSTNDGRGAQVTRDQLPVRLAFTAGPFPDHEAPNRFALDPA